MRQWLSHDEVLRYEEFLELMGLGLKLGIGKVRLTGGEPFARRASWTSWRLRARASRSWTCA
jgi:molybdenum cofactor biosynthesis enzyme MoaA